MYLRSPSHSHHKRGGVRDGDEDPAQTAARELLEEKATTEDEMVGWHHQLNGYEFEKTQGDNEGQGSLACCSPWGHKEPDIT